MIGRLSKVVLGGRIAQFLAGAAVASVFGGVAVAVTSTNFNYASPQFGFFSISPLHMAPDSDETADVFLIGHNGFLSSGFGCFQTGVNLPHGAMITTVSSWFSSNASSNPTFRLYRYNLATGDFGVLTSVTPANDNGARSVTTQTVPGGGNIVSNREYSYSYAVCQSAGSEFYGARINYKYTRAGD
jgi:hypothetical protein